MDVVCESCGELNRSAGEFCTSCGAFLAWEENAATQPTQPAQPRPQSGSTTPTAPSDSSSRKVDQDQPATDRSGTGKASARAEAGSRAGGQDRQQQQPRIRQQAAEPQPTPPAPSGPVCPDCGRENEPERRFCARCGRQLAATRTASERPVTDRAAERRRERAGLRAFRESLPDVYRWRRIGLVVGVIALITAFLLASGGRPVDWVRARWYDLRGTVVVTPGVQARVVPPSEDSGQDGSGGKQKPGPKNAMQFTDPAALVDGSVAEWTTDWTADGPARTCGGAPGTPTIELSFAQPTRIRAIAVRAGLGADRSERPLQFRPQQIGAVARGTCRTLTLADTAAAQRLEFDTEQPVSVITVGVDSAYPRREDGQDRLSITEITVLSRPGG